MSFEPIVNIGNVKDKIAYQYAESTNLINYIEVLLAPFDELEQVFADILNKRQFENATTDVLDTYGKIVVQDRGTYDLNAIQFFGLDAVDVNNPVPHKGLGDLDDPSIGGVFRSIEQPLTDKIALPNADYKRTIVGKEHKNNYKGGTEALLDALTDIYQVDEPLIFEIEEVFTNPADPYVNINIYKIFTDREKSYLTIQDVLPKPGGIRYEYNFDLTLDVITTSVNEQLTTSLGETIISRSI